MDSSNQATLVGDDLLAAEGETIAPPITPRRTPSHPTAPSQRSSRSSSGSAVSLSSSDAIGGGRFTPGQIIAERYRVVALAGRGGMGEVYRAEDLKLSQIVAIKFLPASLSKEAGALARFHSEVRIARQVSHPNVCRVFDIGEADGVPFLTMEYVDGEDLASLVRRIGRLSPDKAIEIARQACAGLAAAHERGVIHRDLKPANLMLDGTGKIRITDFGLASIAAIEGVDAKAGTPAYMAPEQLEGREVTAKSDLYSLGLVVYEILTGKRAFDANTLPALMKQREKSSPASPSSIVRDLDPVVERVILRCLEHDPAQRPASALQIAAALPGGDPLAAALAAGETPSPEMVAAAGQSEGMRPRLAVILLTIIAAGLLASLFIAERAALVNRVNLENPPEVLGARAREIIAQVGLSGKPADSAFGFDNDGAYLAYVQEHDKTPGRWNVLTADRPSPMVFWYRQSPRDLVTGEFYGPGPGSGRVSPTDPPMNVTGMVFVILDVRGRLLHLEAVPPQRDPPTNSSPPPVWPVLFSSAGLESAGFQSTEPEWTPLAWGDSRAAWTGTLPGRPDLSVRIEAAAYRGKPVYFDMIYPWTTPDRASQNTPTRRQGIVTLILLALVLSILMGGVLVARWNVRRGRGDHKGAIRLGAFIFVAFLAMWALRAHHLADLQEIFMLLMAASWALLYTFFVVVLYLALEPFVRSREPRILISWSRLLAGKFRDPLIGRDILIGVVYGVGLALVETSDNFILPLLGKLPPAPGLVATDSLTGVHDAMALLLFYILLWTFYSLAIFFLLFVLQRVLRKTWLAIIVIAAVGTYLGVGSGEEHPWFAATALVILYVSFLLVLKRFGLLPLILGLVVQNVLLSFPATTHFSHWYAAAALTGLTAIAALSIYGFQAALAGQRLFSGEMFDR